MTTKQMKKKYNQAPDEWIALWSMPIGWINHGKWVKSINPAFNEENIYKLISVKHKDILDAYLADNSVGIEYEFDEETHHNAGWYKVHYFIEEYNPDLEYRLKEKEDAETLLEQSSQSTSSEFSDNSCTSDIGLPNINSFTAHGFEVPSWEGEILKEVDGTYIGWSKANHGAIPMCWFKNGSVFLSNSNFELTPIKKEWYEYTENFPCLLIDKYSKDLSIGINYNSETRLICCDDEGLASLYDWRLATKAELMSLYYKED